MDKEDTWTALLTGSKRYCGNCKYAHDDVIKVCIFCMADDDYSKWIWDGKRK